MAYTRTQAVVELFSDLPHLTEELIRLIQTGERARQAAYAGSIDIEDEHFILWLNICLGRHLGRDLTKRSLQRRMWRNVLSVEEVLDNIEFLTKG